MGDVVVPEADPANPVGHEALIVIEVEGGDEGDFWFAFVDDLVFHPPFIELFFPGTLDLLVLLGLFQQNHILAETGDDGRG